MGYLASCFLVVKSPVAKRTNKSLPAEDQGTPISFQSHGGLTIMILEPQLHSHLVTVFAVLDRALLSQPFYQFQVFKANAPSFFYRQI